MCRNVLSEPWLQVRFSLRSGGQAEVYEYLDSTEALNHFEKFVDDDSDLYSKIQLVAIVDGTEIIIDDMPMMFRDTENGNVVTRGELVRTFRSFDDEERDGRTFKEYLSDCCNGNGFLEAMN